jgi:hypothetical protein
LLKIDLFAPRASLAQKESASKEVDGAYRSGPFWIKVRNPACIAVQRERSAIWNR